MLHQIFNDFINRSSCNRNLSFSQTNNFSQVIENSVIHGNSYYYQQTKLYIDAGWISKSRVKVYLFKHLVCVPTDNLRIYNFSAIKKADIE